MRSEVVRYLGCTGLFICLMVLSSVCHTAGSGESSSGGGGASTSSSAGGDGSSTGVNVSQAMSHAKKQIEAERYKAAIQELNGVVSTEWGNDDAWNLLGFAHRKLGNFKRAAKAYRRALKLNPDHLGALEYQGELFIQMGDIERAKLNRTKLARLCPGGCEELDDLVEALAEIVQ